MHALKKVLLVIASLIAIALIIIFVIIQRISNSGKPIYEGETDLPGLRGKVEVIRDERGMPHIYAENDNDLYMAVGYVMAQERLWQMDLIRRATTGRLSEIFGEDYVETDLFLRSLRMNDKSEMVLKSMDKEILSCIESFVDGVNHYIEQAGNDLPPEFRILRYKPEPWSALYTANIIGYMGWDLASGNLAGDVMTYKMIQELGEEISKKLIPYYNYTGTIVYPDFKLDNELLAEVASAVSSMDRTADLGLTSFTGSNNWAVSGERSQTGLPLFSNDMHLGLNSPGIWIQMHQVIPGELNVTGVVVPGEPFVVAGHNEDIAWGMTNLMVDDIDLYRETLNEDGSKYFLDGDWQDLQVEKELIKTGKEEIEREIRYTHRGPLISAFRNIKDAELSMRWSGNDYSNEVRSVYLLNRAGDWDEFNNAISSFNAISQNFIYADVNGNIGLHAGGGVAIREKHGALIMPGDSSLYDWGAYVPHNELPYSYNPDCGSVSSANNKTVDKDYPYYIGTYFARPYRINRIREMLEEKEIFGLDDFKRMIVDRKSNKVELIIPRLTEILSATELDGLEKEVADELAGWDCVMSPDSFSPTFFEYYVNVLKTDLLADDMGDFYRELSGTIKDYYLFMLISGEHDLFIDNKNTDMVEDLNSIMLTSFHNTINLLIETYSDNTSDWTWGDIHRFTAEHPLGSVKILDRLFKLNVGSYRVGGSNHTVSPYSYTSNFVINHGASERHVYNPADWDESYSVIPTGISGVPSSEFYCSQTERYCNDEFYKDHFTREAVEAALKYSMILKPE
jgi:penicillin amidase